MILTENKCKVCGEPIDIRNAVAGVVDCRYCGASYSIGNNVEGEIKIKLVQADSYLQMCKFDEAKETFLQAAELQTDEATAYFGAALAEFGVQYLPTENIVDGVLKRKLIPISHRYSLNKSILSDVNYLKALKYGTAEQRKQFTGEAEDIEYIKQQFLKHKKSSLYFDAFICVKVSDPNNNELKTQDSIFAYKVYDMLKEKGYSPFYSEKSIGAECVGTDYEAMILYALHCSRCMIIVCFDKEYLDSPWVKNEYRRYINLMQDDRKPEQSLVFVHDKEIVDRLPGIKGAIQSLNKNDGMSFNPGLMRFVEKNCRTLDKKAVAEIEFKKVQSGEVAAKAKRVEGAAINYAQLGSIEVSQLTPDEENKLNMANRYLGKGMFDDALLIFSSIIKNNPRNQQAYWGRILCSVEATNEKELAARINKFDNWEDFKLLISLADKKSANGYVELLMDATVKYTANIHAVAEIKAVELTKNLIVYKTDGWDKFFAELKRLAIEKLYSKLLDLLLEYVDRADVDEYIRIYNESGCRYMDCGKLETAKKYFDKALALDEGSGTALLCNFRITNKCGDSKRYIFSKNSALTDFSNFDKLLKFSGSAQAKRIISVFIQALLEAFDSGNVPISGYFKEAFDRIIAINITDKASGKAVVDEEFLSSSFLAISEICLKFEEFTLAENYFALSLKYGKNNPCAYWGMLKAKLRAKDNDDLVNSNMDLSKLPEYESVLVCADDQFCDVVVDIRKKQKEQLPRTLTRKQTLLDKFARVGFSEEELTLLNGPYNVRDLDALFEAKQKALDLIIQKDAAERERIENKILRFKEHKKNLLFFAIIFIVNIIIIGILFIKPTIFFYNISKFFRIALSVLLCAVNIVGGAYFYMFGIKKNTFSKVYYFIGLIFISALFIVSAVAGKNSVLTMTHSINSEAQFKYVRIMNYENVVFDLNCDISEAKFASTFKGNLIGNGHTININKRLKENNGNLENLKIIVNGDIRGSYFVKQNNGILKQIDYYNSTKGLDSDTKNILENSASFVLENRGEINECRMNFNIKVSSNSDYGGVAYVNYGSIKNVYIVGESFYFSSSYSGASPLVRQNFGEVQFCYVALDDIQCYENIYVFAANGRVDACFYTTPLTGISMGGSFSLVANATSERIFYLDTARKYYHWFGRNESGVGQEGATAATIDDLTNAAWNASHLGFNQFVWQFKDGALPTLIFLDN